MFFCYACEWPLHRMQGSQFPGSPVSLALFRQERAAVRRERSSELEPRRRIVSCNSELDICSNPSTEIFPAAACGRQGGRLSTWQKISQNNQQDIQNITVRGFVWDPPSFCTSPDKCLKHSSLSLLNLCWSADASVTKWKLRRCVRVLIMRTYSTQRKIALTKISTGRLSPSLQRHLQLRPQQSAFELHQDLWQS